MRTRLIVAQDWDGGSRVINGPGDPRSLTDEFKLMMLDSKESSVASIELWDSGAGVVKRKKFTKEGEKKIAEATEETERNKEPEEKTPVKDEQSNRHSRSVRNPAKSGGKDIDL